MRLDFGQHMRLQQQMKLSPRMIQSMEILQLPMLAIEERIEQELEQNPVLELAEIEAPEADRNNPVEVEGPADDKPLQVGEEGGPEKSDSADDFARLDEISEQYGDSWTQNTQDSAEYHTPARRFDGERDAKMDAMANTADRIAPLSDQLLEQWMFVEVSPEVLRAGEHLIRYIDDDGFLRADWSLMRVDDPSLSAESLEAALERIQRDLEPAGVGARNLTECLRLQIDARLREGEDDSAWRDARLLIAEHAQDLEMNRLPRIARRTGLSMDRINAALLRMRRLDPRPGRRLAPEIAQPIVPDVLVEYDPIHDVYVAALNRGREPSLRINPHYQQVAGDKGTEKKTRKYLNEHLGQARWLIDALQQRHSTLLRVVNVVIEAQRDFLDHGPQHMRPLPMILVADQLGISVGTVSRAVQGKYLQTPRGIFALRGLFSGGTESTDGQEMSWTAVQAKLQEIVDGEDPAEPYSDEQLVDQLKGQGIDIARRTVAKYRGQLNIPPARRRRRF